MLDHRPIIRATAAAAMALIFGALTSAAWAQSLTIKTDNVSINGGFADFGAGGHNLGGPGNGTVTWSLSTVNGSLVVSARVRGRLYWDALQHGCAGVDIKFMTGSSQPAPGNSQRTARLCGPGGDANLASNQVAVDETFANSDLGSVVISTCENTPSIGLCLGTGRSVGGATYQYGHNDVKVDAPPDLKKYDVSINNGNTDFGTGLHAAGGPSGSGHVTLKYPERDGKVTGIVSGTLYWDDLFLGGCSQLIIDFETSSGSVLESRTIHVCGTGGNANDLKNKIDLLERFISGSLFKIRLRVGTLADGSFKKVKTKLCDFKECKDQ